jgi:hypothetical protein
MIGIGNKIPFSSGFPAKLGEETPVIRARGEKANCIMRAELFYKFQRFEQGSRAAENFGVRDDP